MFKVNSKDNDVALVTFIVNFWKYIMTFSSASVADFKQVITQNR